MTTTGIETETDDVALERQVCKDVSRHILMCIERYYTRSSTYCSASAYACSSSWTLDYGWSISEYMARCHQDIRMLWTNLKWVRRWRRSVNA